VDTKRIPPSGDPFTAKPPPIQDHRDDAIEAHFAGLERLRDCTCVDGYVFVGRVVESTHDLDGEVIEYERVPCRHCSDSR
jgi:hypothetical protein